MPAHISLDFQPRPADAPRSPDEPLRILLIGDFSGRKVAQKAPLASRPLLRVDVDNLDTVLQRVAPAHHDIGFEALEHFHPDSLFERVPVFAALRQLRQRLLEPNSFAQAAAELGAAPLAATGGDDLLAGLLGGKPAAATPAVGIEALVRQIVAPHVVPDIRSQQAALVAAVDKTIAEQMRRLLHDPAFQALESAWRGVHWLISSLELDHSLQLHLLDASRDELLADIVAAGGQVAQTGVAQALAGRGGHWSVLVGLYRFGANDTDIGLLAALGLLACRSGGPLLAAAEPELAAGDSAALTGWSALRRSQAAPWIGLAAPGVLMRLPYGRTSDPVDGFAFEEIVDPPQHDQLLWGNGGLAVALLVGRAFSARGWNFEPADERQLNNLPAYAYVQGGEHQLQACAERYLGEPAVQALLAAGVMPLLSHRQRNVVTLARMQSIADPAQPLAGPHLR